MMLDSREWDVYSGFDSGMSHWQAGNGESTLHLVTHLESRKTNELLRTKFFGTRICKIIDERGKEATLRRSAKVTEVSAQDSPSSDPFAEVKEEESGEENQEQSDSSECTAPSMVKKEPSPQSSTTNDNDSKVDDEMPKLEKEVEEEDCKPADSETKKDLKENLLTDPLDLSHLSEKISNDSSVLTTHMNKKRKLDELEEEAYHRDVCSYNLISESQSELAERCVCISNIFRSLSFVPGNEGEMSKHPGLLYVLGQLLLLHHRHPVRTRMPRKFDREDVDLEDVDVNLGHEDWWWEYLVQIRENIMVIISNISGQLNLSHYPEEICMPIMDGLLHWAICPSSCAQDPFPNLSIVSVLSPQRLILEALCKLCIHEGNVDLLLATPPFTRIVDLFANLIKILANRKDQVLREFSVVLLSNLVSGEVSAARAVALQHPSISLLLDFVESAEQNAMQVANTHGINMLRENPEMMGTSLDMLRRAAMTLLHLAHVPENKPLFLHQQNRLLSLVMSQILDQHVAKILADVLFQVTRDDPVS